MLNPQIFREYDIRGIVDEDLTDNVVENIGLAFGSYIHKKGMKTVSVGSEVHHLPVCPLHGRKRI